MPRKTKEQKELEKENTEKKPTKKVVSTAKKSTSETTSDKKVKTKKTPKSITAKDTKITKTKKSTTKTAKSTTNKKATSKKVSSTTIKNKSTSKKTTAKKEKVDIVEYYDLPYRYNQTVVKILAQTPNTLFVYWDISDEDRKKYINKFGEDFFNNTYPVLIIHNKTMNYSFEIEINDFANSWYFNVNDARCDYEIELGRRARNNQTKVDLPYNYEYVTSSNVIEAPNNHILFEKAQKILFFRNVKTNALIQKDASSFEFMKYIGQIYNVYNIYQKIYKDEAFKDIQNPSSGFKL